MARLQNKTPVPHPYLFMSKVCAEGNIKLGLPEIDDRYHYWRVPLTDNHNKNLGEIVIEQKSTDFDTIRQRINLPGQGLTLETKKGEVQLSNLSNSVLFGDSEFELKKLPANSVNLVFTSPPYFNARPEYGEFINYEEYLHKIGKVIREVHRVLSEGRFFVINISPVLIRRKNRNESSKRLALPFDMHAIFKNEGYDFIDDIIWQKPEGAGWATGRGRRFAADRKPLQYKPVPVTEYVLVYRKKTDRLIDWNIRAHAEPDMVEQSKIGDDYEKTNVWKITPAHDKRHPSIFPLKLAKNVIKYYSFKNDVVLDPFAGIGTTGKGAMELGRRFVLIEKERKYIEIIKQKLSNE